VWFWKGNFDPSYGCGWGKVRPVERLILIHDIAFWPDDVAISHSPVREGFFTDVHTPAVDSVCSDSEGFFEIALPAGKYSLFVREGSLSHARNWAPNRAIGLVEVPEAGVHRVQIDITYKAAF
jgi:hypothetical protein